MQHQREESQEVRYSDIQQEAQAVTLTEVKAMLKIAHDAGLEIDTYDYGFGGGAWNARLKKGIIISEVYRPDRDGYSGGRLIAEDLLREWIRDNPA